MQQVDTKRIYSQKGILRKLNMNGKVRFEIERDDHNHWFRMMS